MSNKHKEVFDAIITDIKMPRMDGNVLINNIRRMDEYKNIPIIMITARSQDEDKIIGEETGADEYITKPFEFSDVLDKINKYLA